MAEKTFLPKAFRMKRILFGLYIFISIACLSPVIHAQNNLKSRMSETFDSVSSRLNHTWGKVSHEVTNKWGNVKTGTSNKWENIKVWCVDHDVATNLDLGLSLGDMGIGIEAKTPITKWVDLRAGLDWIPQFKVSMNFYLTSYVDGHYSSSYFNKIAQMVYDATGIYMDNRVHMYGYGTMLNFKLLADVFPVPSNRHWHITAGFYAGTSMFAKAVNAYEEKPTLVGLNIYNRAYEYFIGLGDDIFNVPLGNNTYMDPDLVEKIQQRFERYGRMGIHIGDFKDGTPYIMEPAPDGTVSAYAYVNHFKPYLGAGYSTALDKSGKWNVAVDLGVIFWGGVPDLLNHDYTTGKDINFTKDLIKLRRNVDRYVKVFKAFPVYPGLAIRISYNIL